MSAGHGRIGKHRKHPGGRGNAGGQHHMRTLFDQFHPGYFGKVGMRQFHRTKARYHCPMINVEMLWSTLPEGTVAPAGQAPVVDVTQHGFFKVGGKGLVAKPMVVKAKLFTAVAEKKIGAAAAARARRASLVSRSRPRLVLGGRLRATGAAVRRRARARRARRCARVLQRIGSRRRALLTGSRAGVF